MSGGGRVVRRLAAVLAADVVGYSRLMGRDENGTLTRLKAHRAERFEPTLARHSGRLVKLTGDGALAEFPSAVDALSAAVDFQQAMAEANQHQPHDTAIVFRIGLHLGDLIVEGDDIYGDGVNVAARLEGESPPGGILISGNLHDAVAGRLKATFSDLGDLRLKNIERPVRAFRVEWDAADWQEPVTAAATLPDAPLALPDKPSIAVLPFQNMSGDPEQEYFADGMVEDIITALSRSSWLMVIARNSSFTYKGAPVDLKRVGRELGVRYALEGSVRKASGRMRITGQLIDCASGTHLWADRFDGDLRDVFDLQDQVVGRVVGAIEPRLRKAEIERTRRKPTQSLDAHDHFLRGLSGFHTSSRQGNDEALSHFQKAIELDPAYGAAYGMAAYCRHRRRIWGWSADRAGEAVAMEPLIRQAILHGQDDPIALATAGFARAHLDSIDTGGALIDRACLLNPNGAMSWWMSALVRSWRGEPETAIDHARRAMRLSPLDPQTHQMQIAIANAQFVSGRYEEAAALALDALHVQPDFLPALRLAAATFGLLGRREEAGKLAARLQESFPHLTLSALQEMLPFKRPDDLAAYIEGLRLAGLPE